MVLKVRFGDKSWSEVSLVVFNDKFWKSFECFFRSWS